MNINISFIIPAYNEAKGISLCINSILSEIKQNPERNFEIIVVNNASTDNTLEVLNKFPTVSIVNEPKKGLVFARSAGAKEASGELLAHIDADCLLPKDWIKNCLEEFALDKNLVALSGPQYYYDVYNDLNFFEKFIVITYHFISYQVYLINSQVLKIGSILQGGNFVVKKWAWEKIGEASSEFNFYGEDTDLCQRLFKLGQVKFSKKMEINASGRRLKEEGLVKTGGLYVLNYFSVLFFNKPFSKKYTDVRPV